MTSRATGFKRTMYLSGVCKFMLEVFLCGAWCSTDDACGTGCVSKDEKKKKKRWEKGNKIQVFRFSGHTCGLSSQVSSPSFFLFSLHPPFTSSLLRLPYLYPISSFFPSPPFASPLLFSPYFFVRFFPSELPPVLRRFIRLIRVIKRYWGHLECSDYEDYKANSDYTGYQEVLGV